MKKKHADRTMDWVSTLQVRLETLTNVSHDAVEHYALLSEQRLENPLTKYFQLAIGGSRVQRMVFLQYNDWCTLQEYYGAHAVCLKDLSPHVTQRLTWQMLQAVHYYRHLVGKPFRSISMATVCVNGEATQIRLTHRCDDNDWCYTPPEALVSTSAEMLGIEPHQDAYDFYSIGVCLCSMILSGKLCVEEMPCLAKGRVFNALQHETVFSLLQEDHLVLLPPTPIDASFDQLIRLAVMEQALSNGMVPGGVQNPSMCRAVWPEFAEVPEIMAIISVTQDGQYQGSREARIIADVIAQHDPMGFHVVKTLLMWRPTDREKRLWKALRRWGIPQQSFSEYVLSRGDDTCSVRFDYDSKASFMKQLRQHGVCNYCGHMAQLRCQRCHLVRYCSPQCCERDVSHATCGH